jgi:hypothetical protein
VKAETKIKCGKSYLIESIKYDNINIPKGMEIDIEEGGISFKMKLGKARNLLTLRNTVDEVLELLDMIISILEE